jgi:hypothetical protein
MMTKEEIGRKIFEVTEKAVKRGSPPEDIFAALEHTFVYWLVHVHADDREGVIRELREHLPDMLKQANEFAAGLGTVQTMRLQ